MGQLDRQDRAQELHRMLIDPVLRIRLERQYYEITKSTHPQSDLELVRTILEHEYTPRHA